MNQNLTLNYTFLLSKREAIKYRTPRIFNFFGNTWNERLANLRKGAKDSLILAWFSLLHVTPDNMFLTKYLKFSRHLSITWLGIDKSFARFFIILIRFRGIELRHPYDSTWIRRSTLLIPEKFSHFRLFLHCNIIPFNRFLHLFLYLFNYSKNIVLVDLL